MASDAPEQPRFLDQLDLAAVRTAAGCARVFTTSTLTKWKALSVIDDACLIVSELVTNAVKATGNMGKRPTWPELEGVAVITVRLVGLKNSIVIEVRDCEPSEPVLKDAALDEDNGRGLFLVDSLASRWESRPYHGGKVVWAELPVYAQSSRGLPKRPWSPPSTSQPAEAVEEPLPKCGTATSGHRGTEANYPEKLEDWDLASHLPIWEDPIHLLVPMVVVDELDNLKLSKDRHIRWRARHSLAVLDKLFQNPTSQPTLRAADFSALDNRTGGIPRGEVTAEILFDPPGHARLPINDDEIVDRAVAVKALAGRQVTVLTYDTNQSMRARAAGLKAIKIPMPPEDEPEQPTKTAEKKQ